MSDIKRACQFLPFDGLSGYGTLLAETGREREEKRREGGRGGGVSSLEEFSCFVWDSSLLCLFVFFHIFSMNRILTLLTQMRINKKEENEGQEKREREKGKTRE